MTDTDACLEGMFDDPGLSLVDPDVLLDQAADGIELDKLPERDGGLDADGLQRWKETPIKRIGDVVEGIYSAATDAKSLQLCPRPGDLTHAKVCYTEFLQ